MKRETPSHIASHLSSASRSSSDDSLSRIASPGHGRRTIRFPSPPEVGVDVLAIQPEKNSSDVIIPPEPALPDPTRKEYLGQIFFSLKYDSQSMTLGLKIMKATKLPAKDFSGTSDPFVKICLLPDKKHKMETRVKRKNLNPVWNEYFMFEGFPYNKLMQRTLCLQVLDYDRFSRNDPIGDVRLSLENLNLGPEPIVLSKELQPSSKTVSNFVSSPGKMRMKVDGIWSLNLTSCHLNWFKFELMRVTLLWLVMKIGFTNCLQYNRKLAPISLWTTSSASSKWISANLILYNC